MQIKTLEEIQQSYDQQKLSCIKKQISLKKSQLFQLINEDKNFHEKLTNFNEQGYLHIEKQQFYEAIIYLNQAEVLLEYAANCGKTIERMYIVGVLHNLACVYQRLWEFDKSCDYIEGIIYNITSYLDNQEEIDINKQTIQQEDKLENLQNRLNLQNLLVQYYLQYCALASQEKKHQSSLNSASKSLTKVKEICEILCKYEKVVDMQYQNQFERNILLQLSNIKEFKKQQINDIDINIEQLVNKAKKSINIFKKKIKYHFNFITTQNKQMLHEFTIGNIMQIYPYKMKNNKKDLKQMLKGINKIEMALIISICHFTMATQMRLMATNNHPDDIGMRKSSYQFKCSKLHHLISIITISLYVPVQTAYYDHLLSSFKSHYQIDLIVASQSILSSQSSKTEVHDDFHLEISSLYRNKNHKSEKSVGKSTKNKNSKIHSINSMSPMSINQNKSKNNRVVKGHIKKLRGSLDNIKFKCKKIADSQLNKDQKLKKLRSLRKSKDKKSRKKNQISSPEVKATIKKYSNQPSRSKSKGKVRPKDNQQSQQSTNFKHPTSIRSEQEYYTKIKNKKPFERKNQEVQTKKSSRNSGRPKDGPKSSIERNGQSQTQIRFIKVAKSPDNKKRQRN